MALVFWMLQFLVGQAGAENGALTVMIGGDQNHFEKAKEK